MPYIMVMGSLSLPNLTKDEGATVYGLKRDERATLVRDLNSSFGVPIATASDIERTVRVTQKGITLVVVNRIHGLFGYDVVSHAMAMTNANRELISFTMYKKSSGTSQGHGSHGQGHGAHGQSHGAHGQGHGTHGQSHGTHGQSHGTHGQSHGAHGQGHGTHGQSHGTHGQSHGTHGQSHGAHGQGHGTHGQGQSSHKHGHGGVVTL